MSAVGYAATAVAVAVLALAPGRAEPQASPRSNTPQRAASVGSRTPSVQDRPAAPNRRDSLTLGGRTIQAGSTVIGPVVAAGGDIDVFGTIQGTAVAIAGDVVVHPGGRVTGDAIAAFGQVRADSASAVIGGTARSLTGTLGASLRSIFNREETASSSARSPLSLTAGWFMVLLLIGLGVLVFASPYLEGVVDVLGQSFWKSFLTGIAGELGLVPAIAVMVVVLAVTVLGILLIPFAIVAAILGVAGLATLGFIAVARLAGDGISPRARERSVGAGAKGAALRGVVVGVSLLMAIWFVAALLQSMPGIGWVVRLLAIMVTYVAVTAGFGAALLSRGGTKRDAALTVPAPAMDAGWLTPTPVSGVVAATRRTVIRSGEGNR